MSKTLSQKPSTRSESLSCRIDAQLKAAVKAAARKDKRTVSDWVSIKLRESLLEAGKKKDRA